MDPKKRPTLADVAAAAGVSKMTASRALRGAPDVSAVSIDKVSTAARDIGYVGNHLATSLSGQGSNLIGVVVPSLANIVFADVLAGVSDGIKGSGLQPVFGVTDYDPDTEYDVIRNMLSWNPAGMIVTGLDQPADTRNLMQNADIPVVQIMDVDGMPVDACVGLSHHDAGAAMAQALIDAGRRSFGYVGCGLARDTRAQKRFTGFNGVLSAHGLSFDHTQTSDAPSTTAAGRAMTAQLLMDAPATDCIYFSNDDLAAGGAFHCIAQGIAVPDQIMLAGFNGLDFVDSLPVPITTSRTPRHDIGQTAARIIVEAHNAGAPPPQQPVTFTPAIG